MRVSVDRPWFPCTFKLYTHDDRMFIGLNQFCNIAGTNNVKMWAIAEKHILTMETVFGNKLKYVIDIQSINMVLKQLKWGDEKIRDAISQLYIQPIKKRICIRGSY